MAAARSRRRRCSAFFACFAAVAIAVQLQFPLRALEWRRILLPALGSAPEASLNASDGAAGFEQPLSTSRPASGSGASAPPSARPAAPPSTPQARSAGSATRPGQSRRRRRRRRAKQFKSRFNFSSSDRHLGPWRTLANFIVKRCFWSRKVWKKYVELHRRILDGTAPARYLVFEMATMGQGLGATLRGLYLCFYLAMVSGRALLIKWELPVDLDDVLYPKDVDWRWGKHKGRLEAFNRSEKKWLKYVNTPMTNKAHKQLVKAVTSRAGVVLLETNLDARQWSPGLKFGALGYPDRTVLSLVQDYNKFPGCAFHSLFRFPDRGMFRKSWMRLDAAVPPGPRLGVHLRVGDISWSKDSKDKRDVVSHKTWGLRKASEAGSQAVVCAQQLARQIGFRPPCTILFESDNEAAKAAAKAAGRVADPCVSWTSKTRPTHAIMAGEAARAREAWVALVMLSGVEVLLASQSTFSDTAGAIGPGLVDPGRKVEFEGFLRRRAKRKLPRNDTGTLCTDHVIRV